ncbi:hypothetical protein NOL38_05725, partial [Streptococcus suis]|uniref:hypothetical protein n=1 Tax=Streptococcus suis TaxID=1307 RepID=UPI002412202A
LNTFHYRSYGTFFYTQKGSIISMVDLPTTEIIEPKNKPSQIAGLVYYLCENIHKHRKLWYNNGI